MFGDVVVCDDLVVRLVKLFNFSVIFRFDGVY